MTSTNENGDGHRHVYVPVGDLTLHHVEWGPESDAAVIFIGGIVQQARVWDPIVRELPDVRCVCLDLRGQGLSSWTRDGYGLSAMVSDVRSVIESLGVDRYHVVGHSLGARIALALAGERPQGLASILLSDTGPGITRERAVGAREAVERALDLRGFRNREKAIESYRRIYPAWDPVFYDLYARYQYRENWAGRLVSNFDTELYWITSAASLPDIDLLWKAMPRVSVPALIMRATGPASYLDDALVDRMVEEMPQAEVAEFSTGHYIALEDPVGFRKSVESFLARIAA